MTWYSPAAMDVTRPLFSKPGTSAAACPPAGGWPLDWLQPQEYTATARRARVGAGAAAYPLGFNVRRTAPWVVRKRRAHLCQRRREQSWHTGPQQWRAVVTRRSATGRAACVGRDATSPSAI
eukprot:2042031-Prymnesium_polylepis.2